MSCRRAASNALVVLLVVSLLMLDRPIAHARHVKNPPMATGEHASAKKGSQGMKEIGVANTKKTETTQVKGSANSPAGRPNFGHGRSPEVSKVVVQRFGPRPHPKKHN
ncbi:hypothetical protein ACP70R_027306 [Stipagrostis hirtigluma subsp. patula]